MNINRAIVVGVAFLLPVLCLVASEPDALIRFADGSVVEIENSNRISHPNDISDTSLVLPAASHHASHAKVPARASLGDHKIATRSSIQHCGPLLMTAVALACNGRYRKRARIPQNTLQTMAYEMDENSGEKSYQSKSDNDAMTDVFELLKFASGHPRGLSSEQQLSGEVPRKRGLVEECCKRPCNIETLSQYCEKP